MTNDASPPEQLDQEKKIELRLPSKLGYEKVAMDTASSLARRMGFDGDRIEALNTAISEAMRWRFGRRKLYLRAAP